MSVPKLTIEENEVHLAVKIDASAMDELEHKVTRLTELLKEANSLVDELASKREIVLSADIFAKNISLDPKRLSRAAVSAIDGMSANR